MAKNLQSLTWRDEQKDGWIGKWLHGYGWLDREQESYGGGQQPLDIKMTAIMNEWRSLANDRQAIHHHVETTAPLSKVGGAESYFCLV